VSAGREPVADIGTREGGEVGQRVARIDESQVVQKHQSSRSDEIGEHPIVGPIQPGTLKRRLVLGDAAAIIFGLFLAFSVQAIIKPVPSFIFAQHLALALTIVPGFAVGALCNKLYQARANERPLQEARNVLNAAAVAVGSLILVAFLSHFTALSRLWVALVAIGITVSLLTERRIARAIFDRLRLERRILRRIVIIGTDAHAVRLLHTYERNPALGYEVVGFVGSDDIGVRGGVELLGPIDDLEVILEAQQAGGVVVSLASVEAREVNILARKLTDSGYHVALSSMLRDIDVTRIRPQQLDGCTMIYIEPVQRDGWHAIAKRIFDVTVASLILILTLPIMLVSMAMIKLTSPGPVLFRQLRVGKNNQVFEILKLRTMGTDAEDLKAGLAQFNEVDGPLFKITRDPRITSVGRILRRLSIDELPQLLCVIRGTMSMVGPRPALPDEVQQWDDEVRERLRVLPGLTGMWQVSGRSDSSFEQYKRLDLYYVDNWSLAHDIRICWKTVPVILFGTGAS
jgi:exopolysaccharide biosynthesis polyprenyl glycosylphosphotransferase